MISKFRELIQCILKYETIQNACINIFWILHISFHTFNAYSTEDSHFQFWVYMCPIMVVAGGKATCIQSIQDKINFPSKLY